MSPILLKRLSRNSLFRETVLCHENELPRMAVISLKTLAEMMDLELVWTGDYEQDWDRNFEEVHRAWLKSAL